MLFSPVILLVKLRWTSSSNLMFCCVVGDHKGEQYSRAGIMRLLSSVVISFLSREVKVLSIQPDSRRLLAAIVAMCRSKLQLLVKSIPRSWTELFCSMGKPEGLVMWISWVVLLNCIHSNFFGGNIV